MRGQRWGCSSLLPLLKMSNCITLPGTMLGKCPSLPVQVSKGFSSPSLLAKYYMLNKTSMSLIQHCLICSLNSVFPENLLVHLFEMDTEDKKVKGCYQGSWRKCWKSRASFWQKNLSPTLAVKTKTKWQGQNGELMCQRSRSSAYFKKHKVLGLDILGFTFRFLLWLAVRLWVIF